MIVEKYRDDVECESVAQPTVGERTATRFQIIHVPSRPFRPFTSLRGFMLNFLVFLDQLTQIVDFLNFSRFFPVVADISHAFPRNGENSLGGRWGPSFPMKRRPCSCSLLQCRRHHKNSQIDTNSWVTPSTRPATGAQPP